MACNGWSWSPESVGAIGSGISALVAIFAAGVALRIGQQSTKLERERQHCVVVAASGLLLHELQQLKLAVTKLTQVESMDVLTRTPEFRDSVLSLLSCPELKSCLDKSADFPLLMTKCLAVTYGAVGNVRTCIEALCTEGTIQQQTKGIESKAQDMSVDINKLDEESMKLSQIVEAIQNKACDVSLGSKDVADVLISLLPRAAENLQSTAQNLEDVINHTILKFE